VDAPKHEAERRKKEDAVPLDPTAREIVDAMAATFPPVDFDRSGTENRRLIKEAAAEVIPATPEPVGSVEDRTVPGPAGPVPVRVYQPAAGGDGDAGGAAPVLAFFHGGGWVVCDLDSHDGMCRAICNESGCIVVAVDYRLAPEHRFPAGAEDAYAVTAWLGAHAAEVGGDPSRLAVCGDSAGGNLAAVVALMARDRGGPRLGLQVLVYPVIDFRFDTASHLDPGDPKVLQSGEVRYYWYEYLTDEADGEHAYASPIRAESLAGLPPALFVLAEFDPLRDEGEAYAKRLATEGIAVTVERYDGMFHSFVTFLGALPQARDAVARIGDALRAAFTVPAA
jgi:acetyl esterase